jgi:hypothetical protein
VPPSSIVEDLRVLEDLFPSFRSRVALTVPHIPERSLSRLTILRGTMFPANEVRPTRN